MQNYRDKLIKNHKSGFIIAMSGFAGNLQLIMRMIKNKCPFLFFPCPVTNEMNDRQYCPTKTFECPCKREWQVFCGYGF